jgi:hypothetical protein
MAAVTPPTNRLTAVKALEQVPASFT